MLDTIPKLQIVPTDKLVVHELHDHQRTPPLIRKLKANGMLRNPPVVTPFTDDSGRFLVLDGANRTTAFAEMGFPHILAQVVEQNSPSLDMQTWNHVIWDMPTEGLMEKLHSITDLHIDQVKDQQEALEKLQDFQLLMYVQTPDKNTYIATCACQGLNDMNAVLHQVMDCYKNDGLLDRTRIRDVNPLLPLYKNLTALVVYRAFRVQEVLQLVDSGKLFPSGITRSIIAPRALRVNYPLEELESTESTEVKNERLLHWMQDRVEHKQIRFYVEPTVMFDE